VAQIWSEICLEVAQFSNAINTPAACSCGSGTAGSVAIAAQCHIVSCGTSTVGHDGHRAHRLGSDRTDGYGGAMSTIVMGALLLGEPFTVWVVGGTVLVLLGVAVCSIRSTNLE
jgi:hypothetical protein